MRRRSLLPESVVGGLVLLGLRSLTRILRALPARWVLAGADVVGLLLYAVDRRGRRVARDNLRVVFGDQLSHAERLRIQREAQQGVVRALAVTLHASPLTAERVRRWVVVPPETEGVLRGAARHAKGAVVVSAHVGNWEMLLGLASVFRDIATTTFLFEPNPTPGLDRFLDWLRGTSGGRSASRKGGARSLMTHVRNGGIAGLLVDRNVRRSQGGIWAPFFGLQACTSPLPALLALRNRTQIAPLFLLPLTDGRYLVELGPELTQGVATGDPRQDILEITARLNRVLEAVIRTYPEAWNWTLKRFKSRPRRERGPYPSYSLWDPE